MGFPGEVVKNLPAISGDTGDRASILAWEACQEKEMATHSSILTWDNPMDRGAWWAVVHGVLKSPT